MMKFDGFDWDSGNWPKCGKHGLSQVEIEQVFRGAPSIQPDVEHSQSERRFFAIGKTDTGRDVFAVFTFRETSASRLIRPISARFMHEKEVSHYEQQTGKT